MRGLCFLSFACIKIVQEKRMNMFMIIRFYIKSPWLVMFCAKPNIQCSVQMNVNNIFFIARIVLIKNVLQ